MRGRKEGHVTMLSLGWTKTVASIRKPGFRGQARTQLAAHLVAAAYN